MTLVLIIDDDESIRFGVGTFLRARGCEEGQGYLFGLPQAPDLFAEQFGLADTTSRACA